jgi:hypothetical protein
VDRVLKIRYWDKLRALELLCKYLDLLTERYEITPAVEITAILQRHGRNRQLPAGEPCCSTGTDADRGED